jgi:hypothetical protein
VFATLWRVHRGGSESDIPPVRGFGGIIPEKKKFLGKRVTFFLCFSCCLDFHVHCWAIFRHIVFVDGSLFLVNKLGLLTNPSHWVRVLNVSSSYTYILL